MREIKFRAWFENKLIPASIINNCKHPAFTGSINFENMTATASLLPAETPIMQFTGLKDKNGKEIWEGDILKSAGGNVKVEWFFNRYIFRNEKGRKEEILKEFNYFFEVIGNIYENQELIK